MDTALRPAGRTLPVAHWRFWLLLSLVAGVIDWDWFTVSAPHMDNHWLRLGIMAAIAAVLQLAFGSAALPLLRLNLKPALRVLLRIILWGALATALLILGAWFLARFMGVRWPMQPQNVRHPSFFKVVFIASVLWAPVIEELTYRGIVQARLRSVIGIWPAIFFSGLVFWIYHWVSFRTVTSPHHFGAGLLMAYSYERSRSLVAPILLHALGNLILISGDLFYLTHKSFVNGLLGYS